MPMMAQRPNETGIAIRASRRAMNAARNAATTVAASVAARDIRYPGGNLTAGEVPFSPAVQQATDALQAQAASYAKAAGARWPAARARPRPRSAGRSTTVSRACGQGGQRPPG
jgi:hypothetical protein